MSQIMVVETCISMLTAWCRRSYVLDVAKATRSRKPGKVRLDCFLLGVRFAAASSNQSSIEVFLDTEQFLFNRSSSFELSCRHFVRLSGRQGSQVKLLTPEQNGTCRRWPVSLFLQSRLSCMPVPRNGNSGKVSDLLLTAEHLALRKLARKARFGNLGKVNSISTVRT